MRRISTALIAVAAAALLLAGCGSGGGGGSTAPPSTQPPTATATQSSNANPGGSSTSQKPSATEQKKQSNPAPNLPPPTPGSKAAAPGVPTSKEGDNSIQTWGLEASASQRAQAAAAVQAYLDARAARDWAKVCFLLAVKPRREQERFGGGGASCAKAMASFAANASTTVLREEAEVHVLSFRVGKKYAFLIYRRPDGIFATALTHEGGSWKLISVTPNSLS